MRKITARNVVLLVVSYGFYANFNVLVPTLLVYVTLVNYVAGKLLKKEHLPQQKRFRYVSLAVIASILPLLVLKYLPAYVEGIWLPVGLSFFTFQALSYTLDVYRGKIEEAYSLLDVSLFTAFFPTLLSGPIERARKLMPQLRQVFPMNWDNLVLGSQHFVWGLFKKMVVADRLAPMVDGAYALGKSASGGTLALAAVLYSFQIYCDFSGYASMALGVGRMLGITLTQNFEFPYFANSIKEFWRRWHISLTSWFTEYVYISLGGEPGVACALDSPYVDQLVRTEASSHFDYYLHKWVITARFTDNMVYRSLRGWLNLRRSFEIWVMRQEQWDAMKPATPKIDAEVMACFRRTLDFLVARGCHVVLVEAPIAYRNLCPKEIEEVSAVFRSIADASPHIDYLNYGPAYCSRREIFCDPVHVNHRGEKLVTEALIRDVGKIFSDKGWNNSK